MSEDMKPYVVRQGDYLVKLAFVHGFNAEEVWNDAKNDALRELRKDHHILAPGDIIHIPVKQKQGLPIVKGTTNRYTATVPRVEVILVFKDGDGKTLANEPCEVLGLGAANEVAPVEVDGEGKLTLSVPVTTSEVSVYFTDRNIRYRVHIGHMDPVSDASGIRKRLDNLGFWHIDPTIDDVERTALMLKSFQMKNGLEPSGLLDDTTRKALLDQHGL